MTLYRYKWRNNSKRKTLYGRIFKVIIKGGPNSVLVEFTDNGQRKIISRNAMERAMSKLTEEYLESIGFKENHDEDVLIWQKGNIELMRSIDLDKWYVGIDGIFNMDGEIYTEEELNAFLQDNLKRITEGS